MVKRGGGVVYLLVYSQKSEIMRLGLLLRVL